MAQSLYAEFKEPLYAPPPLLLRMVEAGLLGRKTGRGFFDYPAEVTPAERATAPVHRHRGRRRDEAWSRPPCLSRRP